MRAFHLQLLTLFLITFIFIDLGVAKRMDAVSRGIGIFFVVFILAFLLMEDIIIPIMKASGWKKEASK